MRPNILMITLDQFRADCLSAAGHRLVQTPNLDALAAAGVRFTRHFSQAAPCGPGRASLYTGMYQMNHRVVANGTPLDARFDNVALAARRAEYSPALFGYTDQAVDPRVVISMDDPRLSTYCGIMPGFDAVLDLPDDQGPWVEWLESLGYDVSGGAPRLLSTENDRTAEHSVGAFLTDTAVAWLEHQTQPWFAHLSYLRPHPPYCAPGHWSQMYDPKSVGLPISPVPTEEQDQFHNLVLDLAPAKAPKDPAELAHMRAQYFGMISHVDHEMGRLWDALRRFGQWDNTVIVVTSDHGEMLGDHGLKEKLGYWPQSYAVPCIVREPRWPDTHGTTIDRFTGNVDVMPTICDAMALPIPAQCDGRSLTPWLRGDVPRSWPQAAHWEYDWRDQVMPFFSHDWSVDRRLGQQHLIVQLTETHAYVQFGDGKWLCFDVAADPTWRTTTIDPAVVLPLAQQMLVWRSQLADRTLSDFVTRDGGIGRWPQMPEVAVVAEC